MKFQGHIDQAIGEGKDDNQNYSVTRSVFRCLEQIWISPHDMEALKWTISVVNRGIHSSGHETRAAACRTTQSILSLYENLDELMETLNPTLEAILQLTEDKYSVVRTASLNVFTVLGSLDGHLLRLLQARLERLEKDESASVLLVVRRLKASLQ